MWVVHWYICHCPGKMGDPHAILGDFLYEDHRRVASFSPLKSVTYGVFYDFSSGCRTAGNLFIKKELSYRVPIFF